MTAREDQTRCIHCELDIGKQSWGEFTGVWIHTLTRHPKCPTVGNLRGETGTTAAPKQAEDQPRPTPPKPSRVRCVICKKVDNNHRPDGSAHDGSHVFLSEHAAQLANTGEAQGEAPQNCTGGGGFGSCRDARDGDLCGNCARVEAGAHPSQDAQQLIRGIVQASVELACLRNDLCYEDSPPMVVEEVAEIVDDTFNALQGIDCCDENPCPEWTAIMQALAGARSTPSLPAQDAQFVRLWEAAQEFYAADSAWKESARDKARTHLGKVLKETEPSDAMLTEVEGGSTPSPDPPHSDYCDLCNAPVTGSVHIQLVSGKHRCFTCANKLYESQGEIGGYGKMAAAPDPKGE